MTVKERLAQLIKVLPEEDAEELLRLAEVKAHSHKPRVSAFGKFSHLPLSVDDYLQRKQEEIDLEEVRSARRQRGQE